MAFAGRDIEALRELAARHAEEAARLHDLALVAYLAFQPRTGDALQAQALRQARLFRVARTPPGRLRVLAIMMPGDLMANTPLGFLVEQDDICLDLLYVCPGEALPDPLPEHEVAVFAPSAADPAFQSQLQAWFEAWPRPAINAPAQVAMLARDRLAARLGPLPGLAIPRVQRLEPSTAGAVLAAGGWRFPLLLRPGTSHAGQGLEKLEEAAALPAYLAAHAAEWFYATEFIDYRSPDGQFRKYRIAFIEGVPFLCHLAVSDHWMIHYLNAGMTESAAKRAEEAAAMAGFETGFGRRHRASLAALDQAIGLDYHAVDCAETQDGRLLVFEADNAAILHMMDPPELFAYKRPQMRRVFAAFAELLQRRAGLTSTASSPPSCAHLR